MSLKKRYMKDVYTFYLSKVNSLLQNNSLRTQLLLLKQYKVPVTVIDYSLKTRKLYDLLKFHDIKFTYRFYKPKTSSGFILTLGTDSKPTKSIKKFLNNYLNREGESTYLFELRIEEKELESISL